MEYPVLKHAKLLRDWVFCLSLANLFFLPAWAGLLYNSESYLKTFYFKKMPEIAFAAIIINVIFLATCLWSLKRVIGHSGSTLAAFIARLGLFVLLLVPLNFFRNLAHLSLSNIAACLASPWTWLPGLIGLGALVYWSHQIARAACAIVIVLSPFLFITVPQAAWQLAWRSLKKMDTVTEAIPWLPVKTNAPRVVWIIFDELDYRLGFAERPSTIRLSEFDRFQLQSVYAKNAYPPAGDTLLSIPSLTIGRVVSKAIPVNYSELMITTRETSNQVGWSTLPNVFDSARKAGFNTGVVGWYHPYERVLGRNLNICSWQSCGMYDPSSGNDLFEAMMIQIGAGLPYPSSRLHLIRHKHALLDAEEYVTNSNIGLLLCHLMIPHPPAIYNRQTDHLSIFGTDKVDGYLNNLVLTDLVLGRLRRAMEMEQIWDGATVIVTSDHWWRQAETIDHRVPLMIKMARQTREVEYSPPFNTVLLPWLITGILRGGITNQDDVTHWLDRHRKQVPVDSWSSQPSD